jgi:hypothetical protein
MYSAADASEHTAQRLKYLASLICRRAVYTSSCRIMQWAWKVTYFPSSHSVRCAINIFFACRTLATAQRSRNDAVATLDGGSPADRAGSTFSW